VSLRVLSVFAFDCASRIGLQTDARGRLGKCGSKAAPHFKPSRVREEEASSTGVAQPRSHAVDRNVNAALHAL